MNKIIFLNYLGLDREELKNVLSLYPNQDWQFYKDYAKFRPGGIGAYRRFGKSTFPFNNEIVDILNCRMPVFTNGYNFSFEEITDIRVKQIWEARNNKKLLLCWSGGIDSTVMLVSILKNINPVDYKEIEVACTRISVYENPNFFYKYIKPNFSIRDSTSFKITQEYLDTYYIVDGELADQLYGGINTQFFQVNGETLLKNWRQDPDELISYLSTQVNKEFAIKYYENVKENINSTSLPLETYNDFFWWMIFNDLWASTIIRSSLLYSQEKNISRSIIENNPVHWFNTNEYQLWAMSNGLGVKYGTNIGERKLASKKYINDFDHDEYYFKFKLKDDSISRQSDSFCFCLTDDYTKLYIDKDLDKIKELFPTHINQGN